MALSTTVRGWATLTLAAGASSLLIALWDVSNQSFGSYKRPAFPREYVSAWLFDTFGHWGPRVLLMALGVLLVALSFRFASLAREEDGPSNTTSEHACVDQRSGTKRFAVLSWTLILLGLSLLACLVLGPLLRNPAIDGVLSSWRERYSLPATSLTAVFVLGFYLQLQWRELRETGDPWRLPRMLMWLVFAIIFFIFFLLSSWEAIFGRGA